MRSPRERASSIPVRSAAAKHPDTGWRLTTPVAAEPEHLGGSGFQVVQMLTLFIFGRGAHLPTGSR
jgi:hypothetical protein